MKRKPPTGTCGLYLRINETWYTLTPLSPNPVANPSWRLHKLVMEGEEDAVDYDVAVIHGLVSCSCPDYHWARENQRTACKHALSLVKVGLMPADAPNVS